MRCDILSFGDAYCDLCWSILFSEGGDSLLRLTSETWLRTLYTSTMLALHLLYSSVGIPSDLMRSRYGLWGRCGIHLVALAWILSNDRTCFMRREVHTGAAYSGMGCSLVLYSATNDSGSRCLKDRLISIQCFVGLGRDVGDVLLKCEVVSECDTLVFRLFGYHDALCISVE